MRVKVLAIVQRSDATIARSVAHNPSTSRIASEAACNPTLAEKLCRKEGSPAVGVRPLKKNLSAESSYGNVRKSHIHTLKTKSGKLRSDRSDAASLPR